MCLGDLAQVVQVLDDRTVRARVGDRIVTVSLLALDGPVGPGDHLQVHAGFALARLTAEEWRDADRIRREHLGAPVVGNPGCRSC